MLREHIAQGVRERRQIGRMDEVGEHLHVVCTPRRLEHLERADALAEARNPNPETFRCFVILEQPLQPLIHSAS